MGPVRTWEYFVRKYRSCLQWTYRHFGLADLGPNVTPDIWKRKTSLESKRKMYVMECPAFATSTKHTFYI